MSISAKDKENMESSKDPTLKDSNSEYGVEVVFYEDP